MLVVHSCTIAGGVARADVEDHDEDTMVSVFCDVLGVRSVSGEWSWQRTDVSGVCVCWDGHSLELNAWIFDQRKIWGPEIEDAMEAAFQHDQAVKAEESMGIT